MKPTIPNKTGKATAADSVMTPPNIARLMVEMFKPTGRVLEPCAGTGNILRELPSGAFHCEINDGTDFFDWKEPVDWIVTNPPYSIYDRFLEHSFAVAGNVVLLVPLAKAFKSMKVERMVDEYGGLRSITLLGGGGKCGFAFGFPTGFLHYQKGYKGPINRIRISL